MIRRMLWVGSRAVAATGPVLAPLGRSSTHETSSWRSLPKARVPAARLSRRFALSASATEHGDPGPSTLSGGDIESLAHTVKRLAASVLHHNDLYYAKATPEVTDEVYDGIKRELAAAQGRLMQLLPGPAMPAGVAAEALLAASETLSAVGASTPAGALPKVRHPSPLLSLTSAATEAELLDWHRRLVASLASTSSLPSPPEPAALAWVVEPKIDGLAVAARYVRGRLTVVATRGTGDEGEDVTMAAAATVSGLPTQLPPSLILGLPEEIDIRGEVYMSTVALDELNVERVRAAEAAGAPPPPPFANARNAAAGTLRLQASASERRKGAPSVSRRLDFFGYSLQDTATGSLLADTQWDALQRLAAMGVPISPDCALCDGLESAIVAAAAWRTRRASLPYTADGAVLKLNDVVMQRATGTSRSAPRWAIAWKFPPQEAVTTVTAISVAVGRTGMLVPVAHLTPVPLAGVIVAKASLHNPARAAAAGVRVGDAVIVRRAGDVIPQLVRVLTELRPVEGSPGAQSLAAPWTIPTVCPACGGPVRHVHPTVGDGSDDGGPLLFCADPGSCVGAASRRLAHYASTVVPDLGPGRLAQLREHAGVADPADLYALSIESLGRVPGLGPASAASIAASLMASKRAPPAAVLAALSIPRVGPRAAEYLLTAAGCLSQLWAMARAGDGSPGLQAAAGPTTTASLIAWLCSPANVALLDRLAEAGVEALTAPPPPGWEPPAPDAPSDDGDGKPKPRKGRAKSGKAVAGVMDAAAPSSESLPLSGESVVVTGVIAGLSRGEARALAERLGASVKSAIATRTTALIAGEDPGPAKIADARERGIRTISQNDFKAMARAAGVSVP